jgi:hypothetical protein
MKTFVVGSNANRASLRINRASLRVYAQLPGDEIQDGDVIEILQT